MKKAKFGIGLLIAQQPARLPVYSLHLKAAKKHERISNVMQMP